MARRYEAGVILSGKYKLLETVRGKHDTEFKCACSNCGHVFNTTRYRVEHQRIDCPNCTKRKQVNKQKRLTEVSYKLDDIGTVRLCASIITTAVSDYRMLERGLKTTYVAHQRYALGLETRPELESFFRSQWCADLLAVAYPSANPTKLREVLRIT